MNVEWETELAELLSNLSSAQDEMLELFGKKRDLLVASDAEGLEQIGLQEKQLIDRSS